MSVPVSTAGGSFVVGCRYDVLSRRVSHAIPFVLYLFRRALFRYLCRFENHGWGALLIPSVRRVYGVERMSTC